VRRARRGPELRLKERTNEEWVVHPLDGADLARVVGSRNAHPVLASDVLHLGRQPIRASRGLDRYMTAVEVS
jgi:hypothetical protein